MSFTGLVGDYRPTFAKPFKAAGLGCIDEIIVPEDARPRLIHGHQSLEDKRDKRQSRVAVAPAADR